ncbi:5-oxoprolinase subunit PxpB [Rhizobium sp. CG5]|uniref:5-oxoprolinase subunit PxpB n=1 Tax=Rhizobium sp. CG5 TaxID=2726076 RepID=UPI00203499D8|nr:5-oxoprolinase subunit PxpB [Rhizobium sp. CG5]MCM2477062.1 5-oxoprolinase subunit PxpB [Rhizobium sp. CG5]
MTMRILPCGDRALCVELSDKIDEAVNARIIDLAAALSADPISGIEETVPTYRSLMVLYDPAIIRGKDLSLRLEERLSALQPGHTSGRLFSVPVRYGGPVGLDLDDLAAMKDMSVDGLIALHASVDYRVYMIGFAPGFAYLGGLPDALHTPRLAVPRQHVAAGAIGIGGKQANINSVAGPSGWRFLGQTPVRLFDPSRDQAFLLKAGDRVRFRPIDAAEEADLAAQIAAGAPGLEEIAA